MRAWHSQTLSRYIWPDDKLEPDFTKKDYLMGLFGIKRVECPQNQWTTIISNFGTGLPASWNITFKSKNGEKVDGAYIEKRYWWIFPQQPVTGKLTAQMNFQRYWINAIYSLKVCPTTDVVAEID